MKKKLSKILFKANKEYGLKIVYRIKMGKNLNLKNPKSLSEKVNYLMLNDNRKIKSDYADKLKSRKILMKMGYEDNLVNLLGTYSNSSEIDFEKLPEKFVLKCNHGCGYNIICNNKGNINQIETKSKLDRWLKEKYGFIGGEYHYNEIQPKIICEEFLEGLSEEKFPIDYKVHCLNGKAEFILCCIGREQKVKLKLFDLDWNQIDGIKKNFISDEKIEKPKTIKEMIKISEDIAREFDLIRIDFYEIEGTLFIGEITISPAAGRFVYFKDKFDLEIGNKMEILKVK